MFKKFMLVSFVLLLIGAPAYAVGVFENSADVGGPKGIGSTVSEGYTWQGCDLVDSYLITAGGSDIWGNSDQMQFAYREMSGDVRITASMEWVAANDDWAKMGVMLRESLDGGSIHYSSFGRKLEDMVQMVSRTVTNGGSGDSSIWGITPQAFGIQRVTVSGLTFLEGIVDNGNGWESIATMLVFGMSDDIYAGVAVTSHNNDHLAQARVWDVEYSTCPELVGTLEFPVVQAASAIEQCSDTPGFKVRAIKALYTDGWGMDQMNQLLDTGTTGPGVPGIEEGEGVYQYINLYDEGGRGNFTADNGYPDESYPGVDPFESPAGEPAAGDYDDNFAVEISACIYLTEGLHIIGAVHDDGVWVEIGGVEVLANGGWGGPHDYVFEVEADGYYSLKARHYEGGGGAGLELQEVLMDGTRILLGDVANGGSPVYVPEPATIALLGLGGLALLRVRKRS